MRKFFLLRKYLGAGEVISAGLACSVLQLRMSSEKQDCLIRGHIDSNSL